MIDALVAQGGRRDVTGITVEGWLAFVRAAYVKWVQSQKISRAELTEICLRAFDCALGYSYEPLAFRGISGYQPESREMAGR